MVALAAFSCQNLRVTGIFVGKLLGSFVTRANEMTNRVAARKGKTTFNHLMITAISEKGEEKDRSKMNAFALELSKSGTFALGQEREEKVTAKTGEKK